MNQKLRIDVYGPMIQEEARKVEYRLSLSDLKGSIEWLNKFRTRHNINLVTMCEENGSVAVLNLRLVDEWKSKLPQVTAGYAPPDI